MNPAEKWGDLIILAIILAIGLYGGYAYRDWKAVQEELALKEQVDATKRKLDEQADEIARGMVLVTRHLEKKQKETERKLHEIRNRPWYSGCVPDDDGLSIINNQIRETNAARRSAVRMPGTAGTGEGHPDPGPTPTSDPDVREVR